MNQEEKARELISRLANDFEFFLETLWGEIGLPPIAEHQRWIARFLQDGPRRRGIRAFRGASKTFVTLGYATWRLFRNPNERVLVISKSEKHSKDSLYMVRKWIGQVPWLQHMVPDRKGGQRDSATKFDIGTSDNDRTPSFTAASITGQITGSRASLIIGDDIESMQNSMTYEMRERLRNEVTELDNIIIPGGDVIFLGTPFHQESLYDKMMDAGYKFQCYPARVPQESEQTDDLAPEIQELMYDGMKPGTPIWPARFDDQELTEREASEGRSLFAMQYMLMTKLTDGLEYPLKLADLVCMHTETSSAPMTVAWGMTDKYGSSTRMEEIPSLGFGSDGFHSPIMYSDDWAEYTGVKMWVDPSGRGADKTAFAIIGELNGYLHVLRLSGLEGGYSSGVLSSLANEAKRHGVREIFVEDNFGQGMFVELFQPYIHRLFDDDWGASINTVRVAGQKEVRILSALEPITNQHRLIIPPAIATDQEFQRQYTRLTRERNCLKHDDEIEALAMCVKMWQESMGVDPQLTAERRRADAKEQALREHYEAMGLACAPPPRFIQH